MNNHTHPNILFITDDQHRHDWLGWIDDCPARTPHLDRLRREGIWHRHAYSNNPLCMPARCSLITGLFSRQSGQMDNTTDWPTAFPTMPQALQRQGYRTAMIGKLHAFEAIPTALDLTTVTDRVHAFGFDHVHEVAGKTMAWHVDCEWTHHLRRHGLLDAYRAERPMRSPVQNDGHPFPLDEEHYVDRYVGDHCVDWLKQHDPAQPFFLWAGFCSPHPAYDAPASRLADHPPEAMPAPIDNPDPALWPLRRAHYAAMIEIIDEQVGRLLEVLDDRGLTENTLVIFVADHGEMLGEHDLNGKCWPHDPSIRVPCLARWPGHIAAGSVSDGLLSLIDLTATCIDVAGLCISDALPDSCARSLVDHWKTPAEDFRPFIYIENSGQFHPPWQLVRTRDHKLVRWLQDGSETLHSLTRDPHECQPLDDPANRARLQAQLDAFLIATPALSIHQEPT